MNCIVCDKILTNVYVKCCNIGYHCEGFLYKSFTRDDHMIYYPDKNETIINLKNKNIIEIHGNELFISNMSLKELKSKLEKLEILL